MIETVETVSTATTADYTQLKQGVNERVEALFLHSITPIFHHSTTPSLQYSTTPFSVQSASLRRSLSGQIGWEKVSFPLISGPDLIHSSTRLATSNT